MSLRLACPHHSPYLEDPSTVQFGNLKKERLNNTDSCSHDNDSQALRIFFVSCLTDHGGSSSQGCLGALKEVISRGHPLIRHLEAGMDVNPSRDLLQNGLVASPCNPRDSQESSPTPQFKSINSLVLRFLYGWLGSLSRVCSCYE